MALMIELVPDTNDLAWYGVWVLGGTQTSIRISADDYWGWVDDNRQIPTPINRPPIGSSFSGLVIGGTLYTNGRTFMDLLPGEMANVIGFGQAVAGERMDRDWFRNPDHHVKENIRINIPHASSPTVSVGITEIRESDIQRNGNREVTGAFRYAGVDYQLTNNYLIRES